MQHAAPLARLIDALRALPGVGPKTAQRMAFHLLQGGRDGARTLATALTEGLAAIHRCKRCRMLTDSELCSICAAPAPASARVGPGRRGNGRSRSRRSSDNQHPTRGTVAMRPSPQQVSANRSAAFREPVRA